MFETTTRTTALVGVAGGVGTTRLAVEIGATLARADEDVAVVDTAYATQGLAGYIDGRIGTDVTETLLSDVPIEEALYELDIDCSGQLSICPARAPFERLARAKTAAAAESFTRLLDELDADRIILDTPPIATNQSIAAVTTAERVVLVVPDTSRGADAATRTRERLADLGTSADGVIANRTADSPTVEAADATVPVGPTDRAPTSVTDLEESFAPAIEAAAEVVIDESLELSFPEPTLLDRL